MKENNVGKSGVRQNGAEKRAREAIGKETAVRETARKETTRKETAVRETARKETTGRETAGKKMPGVQTGCREAGIHWESLQRCALSLLPENEKRQAALGEVMREIERKKICYTPSFLEVLGIQFRYMSLAFWGIQTAVLVIVLLLLHGTALRQGGLADYLWWGSVAAAWMGQMACGELGRHLSGGMAELEQSCYINLPQMWTIRMILAGLVDMFILCICCGEIAWNTEIALTEAGIYLMVPFVLSNLCGFFLLEFMRGNRGRYGQAVSAVWVITLAFLPAAVPLLYRKEVLWLWVVVLILGICLLPWQFRRCYKKIAEGEWVCWN